ncbi:hypothetical protein A2477_02375 [Candidatus Falkowbacteria bacterium RIFOXYC2_FULL_47_12]|uniref:Cell shape determination protein CcmA n=2 Tax=Candidatus Falkowiibacteriota TaxID=1752728 RepID=A0A1F5TMR4_9BACT|nr:MAG: hypothetical protein A2242_00665 [Candidatus Falkowbacteria bacterium RIFOXYA2_FULL_47_9]OGF40137.1 MAG: hypothetical protein A2477_02375 [Candidatus Falkowbacteria bacterium RIFOXYC2_FULL_47_12]
MFKKNEVADFGNAETIIGPSVKVEGNFVGQGNIVVEGIVKGSVKTNGNLSIGGKAKITAAVEAANAIISGEVRGNVTVSGDLELTESARITGDVAAKTLSIARGAALNGNCTMTDKPLMKEEVPGEEKK